MLTKVAISHNSVKLEANREFVRTFNNVENA